MPWPPEDPDMWAVEARFGSKKKDNKETPEKEGKRGPDDKDPPMQIYSDYA